MMTLRHSTTEHRWATKSPVAALVCAYCLSVSKPFAAPTQDIELGGNSDPPG